jgi:hypothetical protein
MYLVRQVTPLLFRDILELGKGVLAQVDTPPICMASECPIHNRVPAYIPVIILLI